MLRSPSWSWHSRMSSRVLFRYCTAACSFSLLATVLTTPHNMPISILRMVKLLKKMKARRTDARVGEIAPTSLSKVLGLSKKVPWSSNSHMEEPTDGKIEASSASSAACVRKITPNSSNRTQRSINVTNTERIAVAMPFNSMYTSGTAWRSLAMRPSRVRRRTCATRKTTQSPVVAELSDSLWKARMNSGMSQVSMNIMVTSPRSKQNQASFKQSRLLWKARKRISNSTVNKAQNRFSITVTCPGMLPTLCTRLASMQIHEALNTTSAMEAAKNQLLLAMRGIQPSFR
mmetsp:Transcript_77848/g.241268  ORF Transcript_77848/g.241268 Transcript_77848/m.241268 type:complete len:288 (+) Transcript_77848:1474-2337(+)